MTPGRGVLSKVAIATLLLLVSCARPIDGAIRSANAAQAFGTSAEAVLSHLYTEAKLQAVEESTSREDAMDRIAVIEAKFAPAWHAYDAFRTAWLGCAAAIVSFQDAEAGGAPTIEQVMSLIAFLVETQAHLAEAVDALQTPDSPLRN